MKWDVEYLGANGIVGEVVNYKNIVEFEKEIKECFSVGIPINFKYVEGQQEIER